MEQQVEIQKQRRKRTKVAPENRIDHCKEYHKEYNKKYYEEKLKPFIDNKNTIELTPEQKKEKRKEYLHQYYLKIKQTRLESENKSNQI